jgi:hypothetical protein
LPSTLACLALALTFFAEAARLVLAQGTAHAPKGADALVDAMLAALPGAAGIGLAGAVAIAAACAWIPAGRRWRPTLACACGGLYLGVAAAGIGAPGLAVGVVAAAAAAVGLAIRGIEVMEDVSLAAMHAGMFGSSLCLYATWPRIAAGWPALQEHLAAMAKLWL